MVINHGFIEKLLKINQIHTLKSMKEQIKNEIVDPNIHWQCRIKLYKKIALINERINKIERSKQDRIN